MFGQSGREERKLREHGQQAPAVVMEAKLGRWTTTSGNPDLVASTKRSWTLRLRVEPPQQPAFEAEVHTSLGQLDIVQPGRRFTVLYDPDDHTKVAIDHSESGAVEAIAQRIASAHSGADPTRIAELLQQRIHNPDSVSAADLAAAIPGARSLAGLSASAAPTASSEADPVELLTKLAALHDHGVLDDEEFAAQKARLLGARPGHVG
jgi:Short C-terminal domain